MSASTALTRPNPLRERWPKLFILLGSMVGYKRRERTIEERADREGCEMTPNMRNPSNRFKRTRVCEVNKCCMRIHYLWGARRTSERGDL